EKYNSGDRVKLDDVVVVDAYGTDITRGELLPDDTRVINDGYGTIVGPSGEPLEHYEVNHDTEGRLSIHPTNIRPA
ncbi:MAG TPA: hypothetical protein VF458_01400, partial [Ktedonobacteraceae bacterium]